MVTLFRSLAFASAALLFACARMPDAPTASDASRVAPTRLELKPVGHSPVTGSAFFTGAGNQTDVLVRIDRLPSGVTVPVHLYAGLYAGSCASKGTVPAFDLTRSVLATSNANPQDIGALRGAAELSVRLPVPLATLRGSRYALSVRLSPADGNDEILCGEVVV